MSAVRYGVIASLFGALLCPAAYAADLLIKTNAVLPQWNTKTAYTQPSKNASTAIKPSAVATDDLVLSAAPLDLAQQQQLYTPLAEHLSIVLGRKVVFKGADNWLSYSKEMTAGNYDLVFDSAHLNAWRAERIGHAPLVKFPDEVVYTLAVKADSKIADAKDLRGRAICGAAAPHLGTLTVMAQFTNPARQPKLLEMNDVAEAYGALKDGKCAAAILSLSDVEKHKGATRVLYQTRAFPSQALSAGPRVSAAMRAQVVRALTTAASAQATQKLRGFYQAKEFVAVSGGEYAGLGGLLSDSLYYR